MAAFKLPHPNSHVQTYPSPSVTSQWPCSNHHSPTATSQQPHSNHHIPMAIFKPPQSNCHNYPVQTTMYRLLPFIATSQPQCPCWWPNLLRCQSAKGWTLHPATLGTSTIAPPHGHQVDIACSLPVPHSSQPPTQQRDEESTMEEQDNTT